MRDAEDESTGIQHVVRRSFVYVYFPLIVLLILVLNFLWEVVKANLDTAQVATWPWRFSIMNLPTTAGLIGVVGGLLLVRMQWAHANRPTLGAAVDDEGAKFSPDSNEWRIWLYNGGPGIAVVDRFWYTVQFTNGISSRPATLTEINRALTDRGLVDGKDYFIRWLSTGFPFPPNGNYAEGIQIARFSVEALAQFDQLDIHVRVVDGVGDAHERSILVIDRLPSVAKKAVDAVRGRKKTP